MPRKSEQAPHRMELDKLSGPRRAYSIPEAAYQLSLSRSGLYKAIAAGEIQTVHFGTRNLIPAAELDTFLDRLRAGSK